MIFLTETELIGQVRQFSVAAQITYQDKTFIKGPAYSKNLRESAIKYCQKYSQSNGLCLLVEHRSYLGIWLEAQNSISPKKSGFLR